MDPTSKKTLEAVGRFIMFTHFARSPLEVA